MITSGLLAAAILSTRLAAAQQPTKSSIDASAGVPILSGGLETTIDRYRFLQNGHLQGWLANTGQVLYLTESEGTPQAFVGRDPGSRVLQLTQTGRPIAWVYSHPRLERVIIAEDSDGNEKNQLTLFNVSSGRRHNFASGNRENNSVLWSRSGHLVALTSNARNDKDGDLYVIDPAGQSMGKKLKNATGMIRAAELVARQS